MSNKKALFLGKSLASFFLSLVIFGCASIQRPQGGPRDRTPPKLLKATPENMTRNFKAKEIVLDFDEFFKLTNSYSEISISPTPAKLPEYKVKKKSLIIDLKDTLEKNTTYVINFGKAIEDVNEGNVLKNFTYVFSTGLHIDSLSISGKVINNTTQERENNATVMLFTLKQDSLLFGKKRPTIFTTTDSSGNFTLNNLRPDDYRIYALKELVPNKIYDKDDELIAFSKNNIHLTTDSSGILLKLFRQEPKKFRFVDRRFDPDGKIFLSFNKKLDTPSLKIIYPAALNDQKIVNFSKTGDTALLFMKNMDFDSIRVAVFDKNKPLDTISLRKGRKESFTRLLSFQYNISYNGRLKPGTDLTVKTNLPIDTYDASLVSLKEDSAEVSNFNIQKDSSSTNNLFKINYRWKENAAYTLTFAEGAFTDIYADKNKLNQKKFQLDKANNYGLLTLNYSVPQAGKSYIVELLNDKKEIVKTDVITKNTTIAYKNYLNGKYTVRVTYDDNHDGKWSSGDVKKRLQPENIWVDDAIITLRPNWEQVTPIVIPKEQIEP